MSEQSTCRQLPSELMSSPNNYNVNIYQGIGAINCFKEAMFKREFNPSFRLSFACSQNCLRRSKFCNFVLNHVIIIYSFNVPFIFM